jgi:hypothetical protein
LFFENCRFYNDDGSEVIEEAALLCSLVPEVYRMQQLIALQLIKIMGSNIVRAPRTEQFWEKSQGARLSSNGGHPRSIQQQRAKLLRK